MDDFKLLQDRLDGLTSHLATLRTREKTLLQVQALEAQVSKASAEADGYKAEKETISAEYQEAVTARAEIVNKAMVEFTERMAEALPEGDPSIRITEDGKVELGWNVGGVTRPFRGLSGGELTSFKAALSHAFGAEVIMIEAGELDNIRLLQTLDVLRKLPQQVICASCHAPEESPEGWKVVVL